MYFFTTHSLPALTWKEIEWLQPGHLALGVLGYLTLMGYGFRVLYAIVFWCVRWLAHTPLFQLEGMRWYEHRGYVSEAEILAKSYASKDYEPVRMLESHRKRCADDRKKIKELTYLYFSTFCLTLFNHFVLPASFLTLGYSTLANLTNEVIANVTLLMFLLPLYLIWLDSSDDYDRDRYLKHEPIYAELEEMRRVELEKRGFL